MTSHACASDRRNGFLWLALAVATALVPLLARAQSASDEHLRVELISENLALIPGQPTQLGLRLQHAAHWHTYWINPGDSGLPTTLAWTLPPGYTAEAIGWPLPQRFEVGGLYNFGYDGEAVLPVLLDVPANARPGTTAHLAALAKWLVCREACIPGQAQLTLDLPVASGDPQPDPRWRSQFTDAELAQPEATAWSGTARVERDRIEITLRGPGLPDAAGLDAFAVQRKVLDNKPPTIRRVDDSLVIDAGKSDYFAAAPAALDLVLSAPEGTGVHGWNVSVPLASGAQAQTTPP